MDLQGLQESLALKDLRVKSAPKDASHPSRRQPAPPSQPQSSSSGLVADILSRHSRSIQPESRQLCLILNSLVEVITNQGLQPTPAAIFAALMSSLESQQTTANLEVTAAMCHLLDMILSRVSNSILRSKFVPAVQVLGTVVLQSSSSSPLPDGGTTATGGSSKCLRSATSCLCQVLAASDPQDWMPAVPAFNMVLNLSLDKRPKVRRRAQAGIEEVLASLQQQGGGGGPSSTLSSSSSSAALTQASQSIFKMCEKILPSPEAAARAAAAAASSKKRQQAEDAIAAAVSDALHLLGLLKKIISLLSVTCAADVCDMVVKLYPLHQPLLTQHANETLSTLFSSSSSPYLSSSSTTTPSPSSLLPVSALSALLHSVLADEAATATLGDRKQSDSTLSYVKLVEDGCVRVCELDARQGQTLLPRAFHLLAPLLAHDHGSVRFAVGQCLKNLIDSCIDSVAIKSALAHAAGSNKKQSSSSRPAPLLSIITAVEGSLGPRYQVGWEGSIPVASELLLKLGGEGGLLVTGVLDRLGEICSGADDAAGDKEMRKKGNEDDSDDDMEEGDGGDGYEEEELEKAARDRVILAAQNAIGVALRSQGPELVLSVLPMNLMEGLDGHVGEDDAARTWMLPLLRMHVTGAHLDFWGQQLLVVARKLGTRAAAAGKGGRDQEAQVCSALEGQIWGTLPSFCRWAQDADDALRLYVKEIALAFEKRDDLRTPICLALRRLCVQTRIALHHYDNTIGYADPCSKATEDDEVLNNNNNNAALGNEGEEVEERLGLLDEDSLLNELPSSWTIQVAQSNLKCLQTLAKTWLPQLLNAFVGAAPAGRRPIAAALSSYACLCDPALTVQAFKVALSKYVKATEQAKTGELGPDAVLDGGDSDTERRCTYIEAGLLLSGGLDSRALTTLCNAAKAAAEEREPALQKKGYKVMAYILESRADITEPQFQQLIEWLLLNVTTSVSAAKRYRLRCIKAALLLLIQPDGLPVSLPTRVDHDIKDEVQDRKTKARAVVAEMVGEIILCLKEANKKTRAAAYELLVDLAMAMHIADPPPHSHIGRLDDHHHHLDEEEDQQQHQDAGGLHALFTMVLGGLVGTSPHMISASVMGLARLLYEFAPVLVSLVPDLLPAVLMLLRSRAREVIKSVLGFVKVVAVRLPAVDLVTALPSILEGILLWAEDSKNKFRLKVRVILERVARRIGFEEMEKCMPEKHKKLLTHIRKANNRRERKKAAGGRRDDDDDEMEFDERSRKTRQTVAKTAAKSDWRDSVMDEDDADNDEDGEGNGGYNDRKSRAVSRTTDNYKRRGSDGGNKTGALLQSAEPVDLLNSKTSRQLVRAAAGISTVNTSAANGKGKAGITFDHDERGRMIVKDDDDDDDGKKKKRKRRTDGFDSEDSDFEDLKGFSGIDLALKGAKSVAMAPSIATSLGGKSMGAESMGGRSMGGRSTKSTPPFGRGNNRHSGDRYKANKANKASGGDAKGSSKVEPYAYWPLDRNMLNRRAQKTRVAKKGLDKVVKAAKEGAARGLKAKRQRR